MSDNEEVEIVGTDEMEETRMTVAEGTKLNAYTFFMRHHGRMAK